MRAVLLAAILVLAGCDLARDAIKPEPKKGQLQVDAIRITNECRVPSRWLQLRGEKELALAPDPGSNFDQIECVIAAISDLPYKVELGFIGNEAYSESSK